MSDEWGRKPAWWTYPEGSKQNPIILAECEMGDLRMIIDKAEMEYSFAPDEEKEQVRAAAREEIFKRWPDLYDHCHVIYGRTEKDEDRAEFDRWLARKR